MSSSPESSFLGLRVQSLEGASDLPHVTDPINELPGLWLLLHTLCADLCWCRDNGPSAGEAGRAFLPLCELQGDLGPGSPSSEDV